MVTVMKDVRAALNLAADLELERTSVGDVTRPVDGVVAAEPSREVTDGRRSSGRSSRRHRENSGSRRWRHAVVAPPTVEELGFQPVGWPVVGSRISLSSGPLVKSSRFKSEPACASNEWSPILPVCQLSSMKRRIDDWSVTVWSTKLCFAKGEITSNGRRGP